MTTAFQPNAFQPDAFQVNGGVTSGAITGGLDYTNHDDTFSGTAVLAGDNVLDPKFLGRHNTLIKWLKKEEPAIKPALPAEISNMPEAPKPKRMGRAALALLGIAPPVVDVPAPELPVPEIVNRKKPEPPEAITEGATPAPTPVAPEPVAVAPDPLAGLQETVAAQGATLRAELAAQAKTFRSEIQGLKTALADAQLVLERMQAENKTRDLAERNRRRAEEITRRLLAE